MLIPIKTNLGPVTAYADAKAHGYTGTREEFGVLLANAAEPQGCGNGQSGCRSRQTGSRNRPAGRCIQRQQCKYIRKHCDDTGSGGKIQRRCGGIQRHGSKGIGGGGGKICPRRSSIRKRCQSRPNGGGKRQK